MKLFVFLIIHRRTIFTAKYENQRFLMVSDKNHLLVSMKASERCCFVVEVNLDEAVGYTFYEHMALLNKEGSHK